MKLKVFIRISAGLVVAAGISVAGYYRFFNVNRDESLAKEFLSKKLFDPQAAQWIFKSDAEKNHVIQVCGYVNAKNRFGGYVGFRFFWVFIVRAPGVEPVVDGVISDIYLDNEELGRKVLKDCD